MASNPTTALASLLRAASIDDHDEILKASNAVLKSSKADPNALHTRIVALLKLDRFDDALRALDEGGDKLAQRCVLEKAYALYKTGKLAEALHLSQDSDQRALKHVAAQVAYRAEKFEQAATFYRQLSAQPAGIDGEENDLRINSSAVDVQLEWQGKGDAVEQSRKKPGREDLEAFETSYNAACGCIARGDLSAGNVLLKRARDLCEALEELSDDEKRAEVLPIMVQQAYVFTKLGKLEEAEALQKIINVADVPEPPSRVIAQNNALAASNKPDNPYMTQRLFESVPTLDASDSLFGNQASILRWNKYAIDLQAQKYSGVARSTASIISKSPSLTTSPFVNTLSVVNAAAQAQNGTGKASLKQILPLLEKRPTDVGILLVVIQFYILASNPTPAITLLEAFLQRLEGINTPEALSVRYAPGLVSLLISLYRTSGRRAPIKPELAKAASYWRQKPKPSTSLLRAAGEVLLESSNAEDLSTAGDIFSSLREQDPNDRIAIAGYVASHATKNLDQVSSHLERLTPVSRLISGIDAAALEEAGVPSLPKPTPSEPLSKKRPADQNQSKSEARLPKKRKIRESRKPADFDETKKLDPERWLPLRERSSYRPKGKKGKKKAMEMTQGGVVKDDENSEPAAVVPKEKTPSGGGGGGAVNRKKGKGKGRK